MGVYAPYISADKNTVLGHYAVAQVSGNIAATPSAADPHASIRWAPTLANSYLVLERIKIGWGVTGAVTAAVVMAWKATIVRSFTVDYVTGSTAINLATTGAGRSNAMRTSMGASQMGANGPRITTTGAMSGQTGTLDAAPFAICTFVNQPSGNATVTQAVGVMGEMKTMYEWTALGQHPVVLANNEGVVISIVSTGWATGTVALYTQWEWAEVLAF